MIFEVYLKAKKYVESYWDELKCYKVKDDKTTIGLPNPYISPNNQIFNNNQFYWDTYFTILGLLESGHVEVAKGMVDNLVYLFNKYGIIPSRNKMYNLGISQQPLLTSMALEVYSYLQDKSWLAEVANVAENELKNYWLNSVIPECHIVSDGMVRYCDHHITHTTAEHESGWDMTSRFVGRCMDILPIDLNCCIYKYESDLSYIFNLLSEPVKSNIYRKAAENRKNLIVNLMWNDKFSFFFDYDYIKGTICDFYSLASYYALWSGIADECQAKALVDKLFIFEHQGGLACTQQHGLSEELHQWDYPNGWPNLHWIVIQGLINYDFLKEAERIAKKWVNTNLKVFKSTGKFWEKYDVVNINIGRSDKRYITQYGFGWTNSIFVKLINIFNLERIYVNNEEE